MHIFGPSVVFADLTMRPATIVQALRGTTDPSMLITVLTSMFMHGNIGHIFGNMLFLVVFGVGIEEAMGSSRFALYYIIWGIIAAVAQIYVDPASMVPTLGASGAIGGVLGSYFILFPTNKIDLVIPILLYTSISVSAWILLGLWFLYQVFVPQEGVANWAHAGGFLAGMVTVLLLGGPKKILKGKEDLYDPVY